MDPHRLGEERSIAYHTLIAERRLQKPEVLEAARHRVAGWMAQEPAPLYAQRWSEILARAPEAIGAFLVERSELATELRQSTPFVGAITPQEELASYMFDLGLGVSSKTTYEVKRLDSDYFSEE